MHRVIIPVDFSETSLNAARFAAQMLAGKKDTVAVLYNNYESAGDYDVAVMYQENLKREFKARERTLQDKIWKAGYRPLPDDHKFFEKIACVLVATTRAIPLVPPDRRPVDRD